SFQEAAMAHLAHPPEVPAGLPPRLHQALSTATALDPDQRPPAAALAATLTGLAEPAPTELHSGTEAVAVTEVRSPTLFLPPLPPPDSGGSRRSRGSTRSTSATGPRRRHGRNRGTVVAAGVGGVVGLSIALAAVHAGGSTPPPPSTT